MRHALEVVGAVTVLSYLAVLLFILRLWLEASMMRRHQARRDRAYIERELREIAKIRVMP